MLEDILTDRSFEFSLLIQDVVEKSGSCLISTLINRATNSGRKFVCVYTEPLFIQRTEFSSSNICTINVCDNYELLYDKILETASQTGSTVVFPSLSLFLMNYGVARFGQLLRCLKDSDRITSVVALIHTDVIDTEETLVLTEYMFDVVVSVSVVAEPDLVTSYYGHAKCVRRKASGKIDSSDEYFTLDSAMNVDAIYSSSSAAIKLLVTDSSAADITSNLTFSLSLSAKERDAKNKLQLPYLKKDSEKLELLSKTPR